MVTKSTTSEGNETGRAIVPKMLVGVLASSFLLLGACSSNNNPDESGEDTASQTTGGDTASETTGGDSGGQTGSDTGGQTGGDTGGETGGDTGSETGGEQLALVAMRDSGYSAGKTERISLSEGDIVTGEFPATLSDIDVATDGEFLYELGKSSLDSITKYDPTDTSAPIYQRSIAGAESSANPYQMVFVSETKAYIIRYNSSKIWIVDPSATSEDAFKTGEIDLAAYDSVDSVPEANGAVLIGNKLFVLMERLEVFSPVKQSYLAVIDTATDTEIDSGKGEADSLAGIPLQVFNAIGLQYSAADGLIYLVGRGNFFGVDDSNGNRFTGGVVSVDPTTYDVDLVLDDGDETTNEGFFDKLQVVSASQAYLTTYASFTDKTLRRVNLMTSELGTEVDTMKNVDITTIALDPNNRLWVGVGAADAPGFRILDPIDGSVLKDRVATTLIPIGVVFIESQ